MAVLTVVAGGRNVQVETLAPAAQASVNADAVLAGSGIDMRPWRSLAYTVRAASNDIDWTVYGANAADYTDEVVVNAEALLASGATATYAVALAPYAFYRVKIRSHVAGAHGTVTLAAIAKG